ncbi:uncharacterized protein [Chelonus insularis]|uniref:uncharacterized protein n=1 Tax=Chelonus insularis TaxID=460826 RepID=UPI00158CC9D4|nr:uncharacterized protein LOC118067617 [Chelonus insularis]
MGNNSSSHQHSASQEMGRGWTQSFPREFTRHHSQPPGHKVLPEPPNQKLRATNNGNIIHNGGTISGRRPTALTLPHDLNKQGIYRSRSTSASHLGESRSRSSDQRNQHCCTGHFRPCDGSCRVNEMVELKRFGSEPDLRYSPTEPRRQTEIRNSSYYPERESKERESRYRGKKKYKAPPPPGMNGDGSSPDSYKWEVIGQDRDNSRHEDESGSREIQPPPRKSRLFKTRAETKRLQSNWTTPSLSQQECSDSILENERRWSNEKQRASGKENRPVWREYHEQDRWSREDRRRSKKFDGKNTLQRSLSSPEFQAELMQVARKVRNKLNYNHRVGPVGASMNEQKSEPQLSKSTTCLNSHKDQRMERKSARSKTDLNDFRINKRKSRSIEQFTNSNNNSNRCEEIRTCSRFYEEKKFQERSRSENRVIRSEEVRSYEERRMDSPRDSKRSNDLEERSLENGVNRRRILEKSTTYEESIITNRNGEDISTRKSVNNRVENFSHSQDEKMSDRQRREFEKRNEKNKTNEIFISKNKKNIEELTGTRSESPAMLQSRDRMEARGQGSGQESTPEPPRGKEKKVIENRKKRLDVKEENNYRDNEKRWSEGPIKTEKIQIKSYEKNIIRETKEIEEKNWNSSNGISSKPKENSKAFYLQNKEYSKSHQNLHSDLDEAKNQHEDIALKLRPTLPKKQLEIPRFSPSAAWRLLSALETPGPNMSTASEEVPVMYEERIERMSRPPRPLIALGPRSSHDKSGDSGVSCDAGAPNEGSPDVSAHRSKTQTTRPTWTPQQDLGEESSSDAGVDSPPPMPPGARFPPRAHIFSLSLPRDDNRHCVYTPEKSKDNTSFNSLQKIKRSVSGAFGLGNGEFERKHSGETLDDNWLLSTSAPTSLQHNQVNQMNHRETGINSSPAWDTNYPAEDFEDETLDYPDEKADFPVVMKPPSFSYLASGGHVMYLPASNATEHRTQSLNYKNSAGEICGKLNNLDTKNNKISELNKNINKANEFINGFNNGFHNKFSSEKSKESLNLYRERSFTELGNKNKKYSNFSKSCENISEMKQRSSSPVNGPESLQDKKNDTENVKVTIKPNPKGKRFTFQSTVRQIERRRLAEKLSREAEAKERQRKSELEAMRKVEEEFQRKRAKEKANIRQQLRLYSMDENSSSLPPPSDSSHMSRADPDGAPSSSASSPTSAPPGKLINNRKGSVSSDEYHRKKECRVQQKQEPREYKDYRPKYYDWAPNTESSSHLEVKQTTVHPKIVCDIPKSSHVFVDANIHTGKHANLNSTPRSDNYRKDFAHGAVAAKSSLASSDSELSQPNTRPHSRQNGNKNSKPIRSREEALSSKAETEQEEKTTLTRSVSSARSSEVASSEEETPVEAIQQQRNHVNMNNGFILNAVQPFVREKSYRPITFNPQPPPPIPTLTWAKSVLGAAYYNMTTSELFIMEDTVEDGFSYNITKVLYRQIQPRYVLIINGTPESFINVIKKIIVEDRTDEEDQSSPSNSSYVNRMAGAVLKFLPKNDNTYENCFHRVRCLKLECEPENASNAERIIFLNSLFNFKSCLMIQALGVLLRYLDENWNRLSLNPSGQAQFVTINTIKLKDLVMIEENTYRILNIIRSRFHPSLFKHGVSSKSQGTSLFTFLNRCQSRAGSLYLWKLMRHPTRNIEILHDRHRAIEFFLHIDNQNVIETMKSCLRQVYRVPSSVLNKYSSTQAKATDWSRFNTTLSNVIHISEICSQYRNVASIFGKIADSAIEGIHYTRYFIDHIIDFEMSKKQRKFIVKAGVDTRLDELNHIKRTLPQRLTEAATKELEHLPENVETCRIIYVPDIQYCLGITSWTGPPLEDEMLPNLEFKFDINNVRYYKSQGTKELDEEIGDIALEITRHQSQIMLRLINYVNKNIGAILHLIEYCAELDTLLSFAQVARDHNYVKPEIIKAHVIDIKGGRHPLTELHGNFVANDTFSGNEGSLIKIFTGPNACGKTVYLKQVTLLVYMAHIGCFLPVESATIGVVTHILTQIPTIENSSQNASSFLIDLRQVHNILYSSTPNSLIIMDEFGKGTAEIDALALLTSILQSFIDRGKYCPHVFVATHIHRVIELLSEIPIVEAQTFEFMLSENDTLVFLYRLISGNVTYSFAHAIAQSAKLSLKIVDRAKEVFQYMKDGKLPPYKPKLNEHNAIKYIVNNYQDEPENAINLNILQQKIEQAILERH